MQHLITDSEAIAILQTVGASPTIVEKFKQQLGAVLERRPVLGPDAGISFASVAGQKSGQPGVNMTMEGATILDNVAGGVVLEASNVIMQMDIKSAQRVALNLLACTEAAISDMTVFKLLTEGIGLDFQAAGSMLLELRERRQGTRGTVFEQ